MGSIPDLPDRATLADCRRCDLWRNATQPVPGLGPKRAAIMLVGEQPGNEEDLSGLPFVGPAGKLLDRALAEAGLARDAVFVTNAVKHFRFEIRGKRRMHKPPGQKEYEACHAWLEEEIALVAPRVVVALGATAVKSVFMDHGAKLTEMLNREVPFGDFVVIPTYHPSFALRAPTPEARDAGFRTIRDALKIARARAAR